MNAGFAADSVAASGNIAAAGDQTGQSAPAAALAGEVGKIANFKLMSHLKKEERIASAVRVAVIGATAYKNPADTTAIASELAAAAAGAAPSFKDAIFHSVTSIPSVAGIDGASGQIQAAVESAATKAEAAEQQAASPTNAGQRPWSVENAPAPAATETTAPAAVQTPPAATEPIAPAAAPSSNSDSGAVADADQNVGRSATMAPWTIPNKIDLGQNASLHFTADLSARYDDNVFLTDSGKTGDEIFSETPGVLFQFGQNSLANGSLNYQEDFLQYAHKTGSDQQLGIANGTFGYDNDRLDISANAAYQQYYENEQGFFVNGQRTIVRYNTLSLGANEEVNLTEKTSLGVGQSYGQTHYLTAGLVDNDSYGLPVNFYYSIRPKVALSAGYSYGEIRTPGNGPGNTQINKYYNIGARGDFTAKLSGNFTVGYTDSVVAQQASSNLLAFDGNFAYAMSAKTNWTLNGSRTFSAGPQGEQLKVTSVTLTESTALTPQWQAGASLNYQNDIYPAVRTDNLFGGNVSASYTFSSNLNMALSYGLSDNNSTLSSAKYVDNTVSLTLGLKY
jgi:hypothetical protein